MKLHPSWNKAALSAWADAVTERLHEMPQREIPLNVDPSWSHEERRRRVTTAAAMALRIHPALRRGLVTWRFGGQPLAPDATDGGNQPLQEAVDWLWDGMRRLPYTDAQIAAAIGVCVQLFSLGLTKGPADEGGIASRAFGPSFEVEFGGADGSYARAYAAKEALRQAMRDDITQVFVEEHQDLLRSPEQILQAIFAPQRLFNFERLCAIFAEQIIPWQVLTRSGWVAFFAPSRLRTFGLP